MQNPTCPTCISLQKIGVKTVDPDTRPWIDSPPAEADDLEVFAPGWGHSTTVQIRRCKGCGTLYRYRYHSEYDVTGSWDEYFLWQVGAVAQGVIGALLVAPANTRGEQLAHALHHELGDLREDASLLLWILMDEAENIEQPLLLAACKALADPVFLAGNYCYRALLSYAYRGKTEASLLKETLEQARIAELEKQFAWILLKECEKVTSI